MPQFVISLLGLAVLALLTYPAWRAFTRGHRWGVRRFLGWGWLMYAVAAATVLTERVLPLAWSAVAGAAIGLAVLPALAAVYRRHLDSHSTGPRHAGSDAVIPAAPLHAPVASSRPAAG